MHADKASKLAKFLENVAKTEGLGANPKITIDRGSGAGEGYIGVNFAVEVSTEKKLLKLFVKTAPDGEKVGSGVYIKDLFAREIFFYKKIYPEFSRFQAERKLTDRFVGVSKCYATNDDDCNEAIVFEDLKDAGYVLYDKNLEIDDEHLVFVFKQLARFHAVSYAMKSQEPQLFGALSSKWECVTGACVKATGVHLLITHYARELGNMFDPVKDEHVLKRIRGLPEVLMGALENAQQFSDGYSVLAHGDCWYNNFLFKYEDPARRVLADVKILDWQILHVNSPVIDLSQFFYGVATKSTLSKLDSYMKLYHETLSKNIEEMGSDPNELYPYSAFEDHWKRASRYGLMISLGIQKIGLTDQEDLAKIHELIGEGKTIGEAFLYEIKKEALYRQRIKDVVEHFVDNDFI